MTRPLLCLLAVSMMGATPRPFKATEHKGPVEVRTLPEPIDCSPKSAEIALWLALEHLEPMKAGNKLTEQNRLEGRQDHLNLINAVHAACVEASR